MTFVPILLLFCPLQVMKTYHMYHTESISAESKLKDAEKQEEKQFSKSGDLNVNLLRHEERAQRRSSVRKIEKMKEKVVMSFSIDEPNAFRAKAQNVSSIVHLFTCGALLNSVSEDIIQPHPFLQFEFNFLKLLTFFSLDA